jgi:hypothetical protein
VTLRSEVQQRSRSPDVLSMDIDTTRFGHRRAASIRMHESARRC